MDAAAAGAGTRGRHLIEWERQRTGNGIEVGSAVSPQLVFFGVESQPRDPSQFVISIEAVSGALFILVALTLVGPGQQLGRSLARVSNRVVADTVNIGGSLAGILLFTACSRWELGPAWWFAAVSLMIAYLWRPRFRLAPAVLVTTSAAVVLVASLPIGRPTRAP